MSKEIDFIQSYLVGLPVKPCEERTLQYIYSKYLARFLPYHEEVVNQDIIAHVLEMYFSCKDKYWFTSYELELLNSEESEEE